MSKQEKDLEHRALLGDRQAQDECTRQGIVLPCPLCGKQVKRSVSGMLFYCPKCHFHTAFHSDAVNKEAALFIWNRRPAPPIGRCYQCRHFTKDDFWCDVNETNMENTDFCSYFEEAPHD